MTLKKVRQVRVRQNQKVVDLIEDLSEGGVLGAGRLGQAAKVMARMVKDKDCKVFLGVAGPMVPGGMKQVLITMLEQGWIDVLVTTGATLTHDAVEALGYSHYIGDPDADDAQLHKQGYDRMYDSYMPNKVYEGLETFVGKHIDELAKTASIREFLSILGSRLPRKEPSILATCARLKIPIFCPALADSGIGLMVWGQLAKGRKVDVRAFEDLKEILDIAWTARRCGVIYIGGGVPKNFIQQAMQFAPKAAVYGVQVTTDRPEPGGSSGASLKEGISWGKMNPKGDFVDVYCDATIALPLLVSYCLDKTGKT